MMSVSEKVGIPIKLLFNTISISQAATVSGLFKELGNRIAAHEYDDPTFQVDLFSKDVTLAVQINPLTAVIGFADLILEQEVPDSIREDLSLLSREAKHMAEVIKNMLTFARKHPVIKTRQNINNIIRKVLEIRAYEHRLNNIQVTSQMAVDLPDITGDYFQLQQVILNIIINAEYFMKESHDSGTLIIRTEKTSTGTKVFLTDNGPGIPRDNLARIFNPFFTTKPEGKGTGLGLSICYGIITEHNGQIHAESEMGKGTTFIIELPASV